MPRSDDTSVLPNGFIAGGATPYHVGLDVCLFAPLEATRDEAGVWIVTFPEDDDDRR